MVTVVRKVDDASAPGLASLSLHSVGQTHVQLLVSRDTHFDAAVMRFGTVLFPWSKILGVAMVIASTTITHRAGYQLGFLSESPAASKRIRRAALYFYVCIITNIILAGTTIWLLLQRQPDPETLTCIAIGFFLLVSQNVILRILIRTRRLEH